MGFNSAFKGLKVNLTQSRDRWRAVMDTLMNSRVPYTANYFLTSRGTVSLSRTLLHSAKSRHDKGFLCSPTRPDWLWCSHHGSVRQVRRPGRETDHSTVIHLVLVLQMREELYLCSPYTPTWCEQCRLHF